MTAGCTRRGRFVAALLGIVAATALGACSRAGHEAPNAVAAAPARTVDAERTDSLRAFERSTRSTFDFAHATTAETALGPDPWALAPLDDGRWVGVLRGRSRVVLLSADAAELGRAAGPRAAMSVATSPDGDVFVAAGLGREIARFTVRGNELVRAGAYEISGARGFRELVWRDGLLYALDAVDGRIFVIERTGRVRTEIPTCASPVQLRVTAKSVVVACLFEHSVVARPIEGGAETIVARHDGPIWAFDAEETADGLVVAAGGVEDHPLDRTEGSFGYIDSFLFLYRAGHRTLTVNLSEHGVVTPKSVVLGSGAVFVVGYGAGAFARVDRTTGAVTTTPVVPGVRAAVPARRGGWLMADPLLDAWVVVDEAGAPRVVPVADDAPPRSTSSRLGEALVFTTLMAPWNASEGRLSRFTCETCHFEGYGDGRVHWTGRADASGARIHASTKPLYGLLSNRPHFSRALDPDLSTVAMNEFRVANANSGHDPWFAVDARNFPWLAGLGVTSATIPPEELRRAFIAFLADFTHAPNPATLGRKAFDTTEARGATVFRGRCAECHAPRLDAADEATALPFSRWESAVMSDAAPVVWGRGDYALTGVVPYVNERGARVPSLRRLYAKWPYFTNGSATSLDEVLSRVRYGGPAGFSHASGEGTPLDADEQRALRAFLDLL